MANGREQPEQPPERDWSVFEWPVTCWIPISASIWLKTPAWSIGSLSTDSTQTTAYSLHYAVWVVLWHRKNNSQQRNLAALENFIAPLTIVDFTLDAAKKSSKLRNNLQKSDTPVGAYDIQIAAIAISLNMALLTNNTREFERIKGLKLGW